MMGRRGPARTPTETLKRRGSWLAKTRADIEEVPPMVCALPDPPPWIGGARRVKLYREIGEYLVASGVMREQDASALSLLAAALQTWIEADADISKRGTTQTTKDGYEAPRPAVAIRNKAWDSALKIMKEFGLTPASRSIAMVKNGGAEKAKRGKREEKALIDLGG